MNILLAEDDPISCRMMCALLSEWGYNVTLAANGQDAWRELSRPDHACMAIIDWVMPGLDGLSVCRRLRQEGHEPYVYVVLLTSKGRQQDVVEGLAAGADDYVTKPFDPAELQVRLRTGRRIVDLQGQLITARESLAVRATHDPLTGLLNRAEAQSFLNREFPRVADGHASLAVAMIDLDHFKQINDTHGHAAGDAVLRETAKRLTLSVRGFDRVIRYGGDEFLLVVPRCDRSLAERLAERLRLAIQAKPMDTAEGQFPVTVSIGVATNADTREGGADALLAAADAALYRAKRAGRNRVEVARSEDWEKAVQIAALAHRGASVASPQYAP